MARDYRTLKLEILAETKQFVDDMKKGEKQVETFGDKAQKMGKVAAAAFAAAAAAAAAYAGKLLIEGVKAAIEDEAAQLRLANALKNVTGATNQQIDAVEKQITALSLANGIADDQLRPAFQRLATATGSLSKASDALTLALDISAATGKSVEQVSAALGKAFEGNTASLARLGVGLSTAEIKSLGLDGTMKQLAQTFQGAASVQANTLEGQIKRLQVAFDEAKETVGAALLPTLQKLLDYFINVVIPNFIKFKDAAIAPVTAAIERNKESLTTLYNFMRQYVIPIIVEGFGDGLKFVGRIASGIVDIIGNVVEAIRSVISFAIDQINRLIGLYNASLAKLPFFDPIKPISKGSSVSNAEFESMAKKQASERQAEIDRLSLAAKKAARDLPAAADTSLSKPKAGNSVIVEKPAQPGVEEFIPNANVNWMPQFGADPALIRAREFGHMVNMPASNLIPGHRGVRFLEAEMGNPNVAIYVQAPSVIDEEGFKRAVVDALNESANRGTGGGGGIRDTAQVL